jgi:hypothetical protein
MTFAQGDELAVVLLTDELDEVFVFTEPPIDADRPRLRAGSRIVDRDVDLDAPVLRATEFSRDPCPAREARAPDV